MDMVAFALLLFGIIVGALSVALFSVWGAPVVLLIVLGVVAYLTLGRKGDKSLGTIERSKRHEPTGRPRAASGSADTANRRQGQL